MNSVTTDQFRQLYIQAPLERRRKIRRAYQLWQQNPAHPSLRFKKVHTTLPIYRPHNRKALDEHPLRFKIELIEGSLIAPEIIQQVRSHADGVDRVLVSLDSNHTHEHVFAELNAYADLVTVGSYCIVFDTVVEDLPAGSFPDRP